MKRFYKFGILTALLLALVSLVVAVPVSAAEHQPFLSTVEDGEDTARIEFGQNLLYAGNNAVNSASAKGLMFSFGNRMEIQGEGEYSIAAANILEIHGITQKDLFAAGNLIHLAEDAKIGRDVYLAGNEVRISSNLSGNLAATASKITFSNVTIDGDVNLAAEQIIFNENVSIRGTLVYNDDAKVSGLDHAAIANVETYIDAEAEVTAAELWTAQAIEAAGTFIIALILIIVFPRLKERIATESTIQRFGSNFLSGLGFLVLVPILSIFLMISILGMKAGLLLLVAWFLLVCLTGVFTGMWLGYLVVEKLLRSRAPFVVEAAVGILILGCLALIPGVDMIAPFVSVIFGTGLIVSCVRPPKSEQAPIEEPTKPLENPFRGQNKKSSTKVAKASAKSNAKKTVAKNTPTLNKSSNNKATKPTRKPSRKK